MRLQRREIYGKKGKYITVGYFEVETPVVSKCENVEIYRDSFKFCVTKCELESRLTQLLSFQLDEVFFNLFLF